VKALSVRLPDGVHERLRREAFEQRVSMNDIVTEALGQRFDVWDRDDSGPWPVSRTASRAAERTSRGAGPITSPGTYKADEAPQDAGT
jgi:hypothetical protein